MTWTRLKELVETPLSDLTQPTRSDWIFALRTVSAGLIALLLAYGLKLDHPQWAMMTVFIVAQPVAGMVLAKGFYRLIGTLAGGLAAVGITLVFGINPWLLVTILALWIGVCTLVSSLLRNPEAYGAALAGYTAMIIALPAFGQPHVVVDLAIARCAEIVIGIVCAGVTSRLILPKLAADAIISRLKRSILDLAEYASGAFSGGDPAGLAALQRKLITDAQTLAEMRTYARLEAPSFATRAHPVRRTIGQLLWALSAARALHSHRRPKNAALIPMRTELKAFVGELATTPGALDDTAPWVGRLDAIAGKAKEMPSLSDDTSEDTVGTITRLTIAGDFAEALKQVMRGLDALRSPVSRKSSERSQPALVVHRDYQAAWRNAVRAALATLLVAIFWLTTKWSEAAGTVILVAVVSSLFAARPDPVQSAWGFFTGTLIALPFAFLVGQVALPALPGFGWFTLFVVPILVPAALGMANPRHVGVATAFAINFLAFLSPHQQMIYDPGPFFAGSASILVGILIAIGVFIVVLPANPWVTIERISQAMREDLARLCLHERIPRRSAFESLAYDRINQLMPRVQQTGRKGDPMLAGSIAAVTVGLEVLRLRDAQLNSAVPHETVGSIGNFLRGLARELLFRRPGEPPTATIAVARQYAVSIAERSDRLEMLQIAASLRIIAAAIEDHPDFFAKGRV
ncbi:FUSC family protein [Mesorhizobium sp. M2D.F.Ca.ET.185.01.1.1]|uniref:FUSC family protein n=1 Tax=unclassified Mesorhizobium TaxID=325217 RepID=UPI000FCB5584|nr:MULTISPECIES: FUSC family protein [unclassified Mesorhizobium]TGP79199.1 FUSC family protein [bacterium M00.F.Ca.ET.227.01.1.1]TGQ01063.1 FUSC family protein [bacterium M00.F.Ca.ET.221.01.1.1]TGQ02419.1 FUSC family protein [bacterium M00.F.Ca.ET.222.01.1.1]TGT75613.1 FUSC family protein [bacterium M00.F.Ca.ET.159.01.1.1]TGT81517.1 FUSC family protein [bacterium M00.F.Ca.ET.157.01.1.1]TGU12316.1 FUSC family protein [bacterium M00.F.Ca.ET.163.01.1.1]TGU34285.1 FUSC family protein [bacterium